jgi:hypothetical protein
VQKEQERLRNEQIRSEREREAAKSAIDRGLMTSDPGAPPR